MSKNRLVSRKSHKNKKLIPAMVCKDWNFNNLFVRTIDRPIYVRFHQTDMSENGVMMSNKQAKPVYNSPKRYETTCYFMPLAVPVWYSTSVSIKINSTKRNYKETVNYQKKLVPYRFIETMTTVTPSTTPPAVYVSDLKIEREIPAEHYISLEPQQKAALKKSFSASHLINVENHI